MRRWLALSNGLLRSEAWTLSGPTQGTARRLVAMAGVMTAFGLIYGGLMGTFGGISPDRFEQIAWSALKVPLLLAATFAFSLPSFFVINSLLGLRDDFGRVLQALVATQAGLTIVLAALGPLTAFWYLSVPDYPLAKLFNAGMFLMASIAGQVQLKRHYRPLIAVRPMHRWTMRFWLVIYAFVGIQMGWVLRPFIGVRGMETTFFREEAWSNAYVHVAELIASLFGG